MKKQSIHIRRSKYGKIFKAGSRKDTASKLSESRKKQLEDYAIDKVASNYESYQENTNDIYNDFNDELFDQMEDENFLEEEKNYIEKFINTAKFWKTLYKRYKFIKPGMIQF